MLPARNAEGGGAAGACDGGDEVGRLPGWSASIRVEREGMATGTSGVPKRRTSSAPNRPDGWPTNRMPAMRHP